MSFFGKSQRYSISEETFQQLKSEISSLKEENKRLAERNNFESLNTKLALLEKELSETKIALANKETALANLNNTLERERSSTALILRTLKESQELSERLYNRLGAYEPIELKLVDFRA